jgi:hypothetical protein
MPSPIWIATALGLGAGVVLAYAVARAALPRAVARAEDALLFVRLAFAGAVVALLPALLLSLVVGGALGAAWGERVFGRFGVPSSGVPVGLALGIALVFALVMLGGGAIGILLGKAVICYRQRRERT